MQTYAKYLGLDSDKVADEFNEFLFAHTSKISLKDIEEEQAKQEATKEVKMHSPYTKEYKKKINYKPILIGVGALILLLVLIYLMVMIMNRKPIRNSELKGEKFNYEYTY